MDALSSTGEIAAATLDRKPTAAEWKAAGDELARKHSGYLWRLGGWWCSGEHLHGMRKAHVEAPEWTGPSYQACADAGSVAGAYPESSRRRELSFSHHREAMSLPEPERSEMLDRAEREGMSCRKLRDAVERRNAELRPRRIIVQTPPEPEGPQRPLLITTYQRPPKEVRVGRINYVTPGAATPTAPQAPSPVPAVGNVTPFQRLPTGLARRSSRLDGREDPRLVSHPDAQATRDVLRFQSEADEVEKKAARLTTAATALAERVRPEVAEPEEVARVVAALRAAGEAICRVANVLEQQQAAEEPRG